MSLLAKVAGRVRSVFAGFYADNDEETQMHVNTRGDQMIAQALPELTEIVRMGDSWVVMGPAVALVAALPTVAAGLSLWNGESGPQAKTYVIDSCGIMDVVVDATQTDQTAIVCMNNVTPVATPTDAALSIRSLSGRKYGGKARTLSLGAVTDDGWVPLGNSLPGAAGVAGSVWKVTDVPVKGLYQVCPGGMFSIAGIKVADAAAGSRYFIRWHEVRQPVVA